MHTVCSGFFFFGKCVQRYFMILQISKIETTFKHFLKTENYLKYSAVK